ncbi:polysaccharide biosynthesis C-terminal domain-containing protein [Magnetococcus sp. PR-3]|uniref:polysaccharide biosynthesis C-terminal domain-containing protein n=1 Tax=Magnetococcus sp. PR-3 TaxID=3120355 RepID=UPI002FCDFB59
MNLFATFFRLFKLQMVVVFLSLIVMYLVGKFVAPEIYATYQLFLSFLTTAIALGMSWTHEAFVRQAREELQNHNSMATSAGSFLFLRGLFFAAIILVGLIVNHHFNLLGDNHLFGLFFLIIAFSIVVLADGYNYLLIAQSYFTGNILIKVFVSANLLFVLVTHVLLDTPLNWSYFAYAYLAGYGMAIGLFIARLVQRKTTTFHIAKPRMMAMIHYGWSTPFGIIGGVIFNWIDLWSISYLLDLKQAGIYIFAYLLINFAYFILTPLSNMLTVRFMDVGIRQDREHIRLYSQRATTLLLISFALLPLLQVAVTTLFPLLGLSQYAGAEIVLVLLLIGTCIQMGIILFGNIWKSDAKLVPLSTVFSILSALVNFAGNALLIPIYGIKGAALATLLALAWNFTTRIWMAERFYGGQLFAKKLYLLIPTFSVLACWINLSGASLSNFLLSLALTTVMLLLFRWDGMLVSLQEIYDIITHGKAPWLQNPRWVAFLNWLSKPKTTS